MARQRWLAERIGELDVMLGTINYMEPRAQRQCAAEESTGTVRVVRFVEVATQTEFTSDSEIAFEEICTESLHGRVHG